jgi:superfamily II DNA or RNA helicase
MADLSIERFNSVYNKIHCDAGVAFELGAYFTFQLPGAKFMPSVRKRQWDGKVRLFNTGTHLIYAGLNPYIEQFAKERDYEVEYLTEFAADEYSVEEAETFLSKLSLTHEARDYQLDAYVYAIRHRRTLLVSPTASGKSFIIFLIVCYLLLKTKGKILIVVPTTSLVHQMCSDFDSYTTNKSLKALAHKIMYGYDLETDKRVIVSTWQSIYKQPKKWFEQFSSVVGDEAHLFKSKSLTGILGKMPDCDYRFGFTGTLDGTQTHKLILEGLFGASRKVISTAELIEQKHVADLDIKCIVLKYTDEEREAMKKAQYQDEMDWLVRHEGRNRFIKNLALSLKGNTLVLYQYVEKHGKILYDMIQGTGRDVVIVHGDVDAESREEIRFDTEESDSKIIVASYGTFSTGVNIKNLHNIIFASPSKSRIRNLQSIGRGLRKSDTKNKAVLYDVADDLTWKSHKNFTLLHFAERIKIYGEEQFDYKIYTVKLKGNNDKSTNVI